jgi:microsomal triglyceride transfer protein large subunit
MIHDLSRYIHLHNGLVVHYEAQSAASLDLSGMASVSLWNKNSHSVIRVRLVFFIYFLIIFSNFFIIYLSSGLSVRSHIDILNDFIVSGINVTISTDVVVDYITDIDYSDTPVQVCMQMTVQPAKI